MDVSLYQIEADGTYKRVAPEDLPAAMRKMERLKQVKSTSEWLDTAEPGNMDPAYWLARKRAVMDSPPVEPWAHRTKRPLEPIEGQRDMFGDTP